MTTGKGEVRGMENGRSAALYWVRDEAALHGMGKDTAAARFRLREALREPLKL